MSELDIKKLDSIVTTTRAGASLIPVIGGLIGELVTSLIPNQRMDRIAEYLKRLDIEVDKIKIAIEVQGDGFIALLEDSFIQAARATSKKRREYIEKYVLFCSDKNNVSFDFKKKLFDILGSLTDDDIEVLFSYSMLSGYHLRQKQFPIRWATIGQYDSMSDDQKLEYNSKKLQLSLHHNVLVRNGLLLEKREVPDPDRPSGDHLDEDTGLPKILDYEISDTGRILLLAIKVDYKDERLYS